MIRTRALTFCLPATLWWVSVPSRAGSKLPIRPERRWPSPYGFGIFGQVDYRRTFFDEPDDVEDSVNNQFRVFVGARMILD